MPDPRAALLIAAALVASCTSDANLFIGIPQTITGERFAVVLIEDNGSRNATAYDLESEEIELQTEIRSDAKIDLFYFASLDLVPGGLTFAAKDECRSFGLDGFTRAFSAVPNGSSFVRIDELPRRAAESHFVAPCPCIRFSMTKIPMATDSSNDLTKIDDDHVLVVSNAGIEEVTASTRSSRLVEAVPGGFTAIHITDDGRRWFGARDGQIYTDGASGGFERVTTSSDSTELMRLTGAPDAPLELITLNRSGLVRRFDGVSAPVILDDTLVGISEHVGNLAWISRGRALIVQNSGSGIHTWDASMNPSVSFYEWDIVFAGPINAVNWIEPFGGRVASRTGIVFGSKDGLNWSPIDNELSPPSGSSIDVFVKYDDDIIEVRKRGIVQQYPSDEEHCPHQEFPVRMTARAAVQMGRDLLIVGSTPSEEPGYALLLEAVAN